MTHSPSRATDTAAIESALDSIEPGWLTRVLIDAGLLSDGRVIAIEQERVGAGMVADAYRLLLTYDRPGDGPGSIVGKFAADDPVSREYGQRSGLYRNEVLFYQQLAPRISFAIPKPVYSALADNETDFILLMQDLTPARAVDQIGGCNKDEAALVVEQIAAMHAGSWRNPELAATEWLQTNINAWLAITDDFATSVSVFPQGIVDDVDLAEAAKLIPYRDVWKRIIAEPRCLWHNDLRVDNVLFDACGGAMPVALLDWQGVTYARGMLDVSYFIGTSLITEDRRAHERALVTHYHEALVALGVTDYSLEECWNEYRLLAIHPLQTAVFGISAVKRTDRGDRMWRNWIERAATMTRDLDSFELLAIEAGVPA
jgi:hypothetical protein